MKNPQKQLIFTCFSAILRSRPRARFRLPAAYFSDNRFRPQGAFPPDFSHLAPPAARISHLSTFSPYTRVRFSRNKPPPLRPPCHARLTSTAEPTEPNPTEIAPKIAAARRAPPPHTQKRKQKAHKEKIVPEKRFSGTIPKSEIRLTSSPRQPASQLLRSGPRSSFPSLRPSRRTRNGSLSRPPRSECR